MKRILLTSFLLTAFLSLYSQNGWYAINSGTNNQLYDITFVDDATGYACGRLGTMIYTADSGNSWTTLTMPNATHVNAVKFLSANTGYAVSEQSIIKTTNGSNWNLQNTTNGGNDVFFSSSSVGYVVGDYGFIVKTITSSVTWVTQTSGVNHHLKGVWCLSNDLVFAVGNNGTIIKTTDGGANWDTVSSGTNMNLVDIQFLDNNTAFIIGSDFTNHIGLLIKTSDGGTNWNITQNFSVEPRSIHFTTADTGYIVGYDPDSVSGLILKTTDGGASWNKQYCPSSNTLKGLHFQNSEYGFAVGVGGDIIKTTNGGVGGGPPNYTPSFALPEIGLLQNTPNPFYDITNITFNLSMHGKVCLKIYDVLGQEINCLVNQKLQAGQHHVTWNGKDKNGKRTEKGLYYYSLEAQGMIVTKSMVFLN